MFPRESKFFFLSLQKGAFKKYPSKNVDALYILLETILLHSEGSGKKCYFGNVKQTLELLKHYHLLGSIFGLFTKVALRIICIQQISPKALHLFFLLNFPGPTYVYSGLQSTP